MLCHLQILSLRAFAPSNLTLYSQFKLQNISSNVQLKEWEKAGHLA